MNFYEKLEEARKEKHNECYVLRFREKIESVILEKPFDKSWTFGLPMKNVPVKFLPLIVQDLKDKLEPPKGFKIINIYYSTVYSGRYSPVRYVSVDFIEE
jgi:hypothetical protein